MPGSSSPFHRWFSRKSRRPSNGSTASPTFPIAYEFVSNPNSTLSVPETPRIPNSSPSSVFTTSTTDLHAFTPSTPVLPGPDFKFDHTLGASPITYVATRPPPPPPVLPFITGYETVESPSSRNHSHSTISTPPLSIFDVPVNKSVTDLKHHSRVDEEVADTTVDTSLYDALEPYFEDMDQPSGILSDDEGSYFLRSPFPEQSPRFSTSTRTVALTETPEQNLVDTNPCGVIMVGEIPNLPNSYAASFDSISLNWDTESVENSFYESTTIRDVSFEFFQRAQPGRLIECLNEHPLPEGNMVPQIIGSTTTTTTTKNVTTRASESHTTTSQIAYDEHIIPQRIRSHHRHHHHHHHHYKSNKPLTKVPVSPLPPTPKQFPNLFFDPFDHSQEQNGALGFTDGRHSQYCASVLSDEFNFNIH